jgi:hypothetical protein
VDGNRKSGAVGRDGQPDQKWGVFVENGQMLRNILHLPACFMGSFCQRVGRFVACGDGQKSTKNQNS